MIFFAGIPEATCRLSTLATSSSPLLISPASESGFLEVTENNNLYSWVGSGISVGSATGMKPLHLLPLRRGYWDIAKSFSIFRESAIAFAWATLSFFAFSELAVSAGWAKQNENVVQPHARRNTM